MSSETEDEEMTIWAQVDLLPSGTYAVAIHYGEDRSHTLSRDAALAYAAAVHAAAAQAEYAAAVLAQMKTMGMAMPDIAGLVQALRGAWRPLDDATAPLRLVSCVSATGHHPYLDVHIGAQPAGQWTPADARNHASHVLGALATVELDTSYRGYLRDVAQIPDEAAVRVVDSLSEFWPQEAS